MARLRKILGALGILLLAVAGTYGLLTGLGNPEAVPWLIAATVGLVLWVQGLAMGDMRKPRLFLGAVGLLLVAIALPLTVLALATDSASVPTLLAITGLGLLLWSSLMAWQARLSYRVTIAWLAVLFLLVAGFVVLILVVTAAIGVAVRGLDESVARAIIVAIVGAAATVVATRNPRLVAVLKALGRAALARATPEDTILLARGPRTLLTAP